MTLISLLATPILFTAVHSAPVAAQRPHPLADTSGKVVYEANCKKCHGARGTPPKPMLTKFPKIVAFDAAFLAKRSDDSVVAVMTKGGATKDMKSFKDKLSHEEMKAVAAYIRSFAK